MNAGAVPNPTPPADDTTHDAASGTEADFLANYDPHKWPVIGVTADVVLLTVRNGNLCVLLVERANHPHQGQWALPGGFVDIAEDLDAAAQRELAEETGVAIEANWLEQLKSYGTPGRDPRMRMVTVSYLAFTNVTQEPVAADDARNARFFNLDELALPNLGIHGSTALAFDHAEIISDGVERARAKLEYTTLAAAFVDEPFTLADLRGVYESVWDIDLHEANFRRKVIGTAGFVEATGLTAKTDGRPAKLYRRGEAVRLHPPILRPTD